MLHLHHRVEGRQGKRSRILFLILKRAIPRRSIVTSPCGCPVRPGGLPVSLLGDIWQYTDWCCYNFLSDYRRTATSMWQELVRFMVSYVFCLSFSASARLCSHYRNMTFSVVGHYRKGTREDKHRKARTPPPPPKKKGIII